MATNKKKKQEERIFDVNNIQTLADYYKEQGIYYVGGTTNQKEKDNKWYNNITKKSSLFDDGYQFGDVTNTALSTGVDLSLSIAKGFTSVSDGITNTILGLEASYNDKKGNNLYAEQLRNMIASGETKSNATKWLEKAQKHMDKYSVAGDTVDSAAQSVGYSGTMLVLSLVPGVSEATMFTSATGNSLSEAYSEGANDKQAWVKAIGSGAIETATEKMFGLMGNLDSGVSNAVASKMKTGIGKAMTRYGFDVLGEEAEEIIGAMAETTLNSFVNELKGNDGAEFRDISKVIETGIDWDKVGETIFTTALSTGAISGASGTLQIAQNKGRTGNTTVQAINEIQNNLDMQYNVEKSQKQASKDVEKYLGRKLTDSEKQSIENQVYSQYQKNGSVDTNSIAKTIESENKVIDTLVQERVSQAEKDGKELTNKEIAKIEEEVRKQIEKGEVDTNKIDTILGGEDFSKYQQYSKEIQEKEARIKELDKIIKKGSKVAPTTEYKNAISEKKALQEQLSNYDIETLKDNLRGSISDVISSGSVLGRSYYENSQKSNTYNADVTKYSENQRKTIQRAMDSGVLNNTTRTHEFVDMIAKLSEDKGVDFDFTNNENLKKSGFAVDGKQVNGYVNENGITVNVESDTALEKVVGHEITHVLEGTELYNQLQSELKNLVGEKIWNERINSLKETYKSVKDANIENEVTSDLVGEYLFTDSEFVNKLSMTKPNLFQKIYNEIKYMYKIATAGSKEQRQLEKVKKIFEEAYKVKGTEAGDTKYGLMDIFKKNKEEYGYSLSPQAVEEFEDKTRNNMKKYKDVHFVPTESLVEIDDGKLGGRDTDYKEYFNAVRNNGITEPIKVYEENGSLKIENGHHRIKVANRLGITELPIKFTNVRTVDVDSYLSKLYNNDIDVEEKYENKTNRTNEGFGNKQESSEYNSTRIDTRGTNEGNVRLYNDVQRTESRENNNGSPNDSKDGGNNNGLDNSSFFYEEKQIAPVKTSKTTTQENKSNSLVEADSNTLNNTKYSLSENALKEVSDVITQTREEAEKSNTQFVKLKDNTIRSLVDYGVKDLPMLERVGHVRENVLTEKQAQKLGYNTNNKNYHGLGVKTYLEIIDSMDTPIGVYQYTNNSDNFIVLSPIKINGFPTIVPVEINNKGQYNQVEIDYNKIKSVYAKENNKYIDDLLKKGKIKEIFTQSNSEQTSLGSNNIASTKENVKSNQTKYSLSEDNKGNKLSKEQQEYFKDSKVRDENGNLEVVYHRTGRGKFNEFKNDKNINFFTNDDNAQAYGSNKYDVYLNIKNPLIIEGNGRNWNHLEFNKEGVNQYKLTTIKEIVDNINKASFEDVVAVATALDKNNNASDYIEYYETPSDLLDAVVETYADENTLEGFVSEFGNLNAFIENDNIPSRSVTTTRDITEYAKENGYDGVIFKDIYDMTSKKANVYATLDSPNQIKNVDNTNPTDNNDIRYQLSNEKQIAPLGQYNSEDIKVQEAIAPLQEKIEELQNTIDTLIAPLPNKKILNPNEISKLTPEDANTTPNLPNVNRNKVGDGDSKFYDNIRNKTNMLSENQKMDILNEDEVRYYDKITNKDTLEKAFERMNENGANETLNWFSKDSRNADAIDVAEGWILMKQYADNGDADGMVAVAKKMRDIGTKAGQTVQAFNIMERMTPEGMVKYAQSELSEAYDQMVKNKTREWIDQHQKDFDLTPEEVAFIMDTMQEVSQMEDGYEKKVKLAEIQKLMTDKLPPERGAGIKAWMRISMLFNPKTQVRNVMGNAVIAPVNFFSDIVSSAVDKQIAKTTGVRTTGTTKLSSYTEGFRKGLYQSYNDFKKGINTRDMDGNRFEIGEGKSFNDKTAIGHRLNQVDHLLGFMLDAGDRGFYEASFTNSINNQLVLNNTTEVTQEMIDIATQEALSRTWQDNNGYTKFVLDVRKGLNRINVNGYGLGDVLIPFAKTPANLTKAIVDYSPLGLVNTIVEGNNLKKSLNNGQFKAEMQHKFVQDLGKATAGTMLYVIGYALANAGITTGESDDDKDTKDFMKNTLGISSYSIKIGDKSFTYDWAQPVAAPLAITSNIVQKKNNNASTLENVISSLDTAGNILLEQSFMESINTVFSNQDGIATGIEEAILELPSRAIPTFMKQIVDLTDSTSRTTFVYDQPLETAINKIKAKIPGLSKTLAPVVDTMGREVQRYGGKNNIFNVFLNPANVNTENISQSASEIYKVYQSTGDKSVMPRVAPYYINKDGEKIILTTEQKTQYQKISGQIIEETVGELLYSDSYNSKSDVEKAEVIKDIVNFANAIAQSSVVGTELSDTYQKALEYSQIGNISDYYDFKGSIDNTNSTTKKTSVSNYLINSDLGNEELAFLYSSSGYSSDKTLNTLVDADISIKEFIKLDNYDISSDYNVNTGKTISGSAKAKYINYVNSLNLSIPQKAMLIKMKYSFTGYDNQIVNYVNNLNKSYYEKTTILKRVGFDNYDKYIVSQVNNSNMTAEEKEEYLKELGFNVKNGRVYY